VLTSSVTASAPGNLFICGEYGVLSGTPAILLAPSQRCFVRCMTVSDRAIWIRSDAYGELRLPLADERDGIEHLPEGLGPLIGLIDSLLTDGPGGVQLEIASEIPVGGGMSSSTAVLVSLTAALSASLGHSVDPQNIRARALPWQAEIHGGRASGVEFFSSLYGGIHWVRHTSATMLPNELPPILIADTGLRRSTATGVTSYEDDSTFIRRLMHECERARAGIERHNWQELGDVMFTVHELLRSIGVSNKALDCLVDAAQASGAWGAKISGAGRGGVIVLLVPETALVRVTTALQAAGAEQVFQARVDRRGVALEWDR
jgi:mevalonate kinase